jgi:hypothetical protein
MAFANGMHGTVLNIARGYPAYLNEFNHFI